MATKRTSHKATRKRPAKKKGPLPRGWLRLEQLTKATRKRPAKKKGPLPRGWLRLEQLTPDQQKRLYRHFEAYMFLRFGLDGRCLSDRDILADSDIVCFIATDKRGRRMGFALEATAILRHLETKLLKAGADVLDSAADLCTAIDKATKPMRPPKGYRDRFHGNAPKRAPRLVRP